jgi:hypothetical protein
LVSAVGLQVVLAVWLLLLATLITAACRPSWVRLASLPLPWVFHLAFSGASLPSFFTFAGLLMSNKVTVPVRHYEKKITQEVLLCDQYDDFAFSAKMMHGFPPNSRLYALPVTGEKLRLVSRGPVGNQEEFERFLLSWFTMPKDVGLFLYPTSMGASPAMDPASLPPSPSCALTDGIAASFGKRSEGQTSVLQAEMSTLVARRDKNAHLPRCCRA